MMRLATAAFLLMASLSLFVFAMWGNPSLFDVTELDRDREVTALSTDASSLLSQKITDEIWSRVDVRREIEKVLPSDLNFLEDAAENSARSAFQSGVQLVIAQSFVEKIWSSALRDETKVRLLDVESKESAIFEEREKLYLDLSVVVRRVAAETSLPQFLTKLIPLDLGEVVLSDKTSLSKVPTSYSLLDISPLPFLFLSLAFALALFLFEKRFWRASLIAALSFLAASLVTLFVRSLFAPFGEGFLDPLANYSAQIIRAEWFSDLAAASVVLVFVSLGFFVLALLFSPAAMKLGQRAFSVVREVSHDAFADAWDDTGEDKAGQARDQEERVEGDRERRTQKRD